MRGKVEEKNKRFIILFSYRMKQLCFGGGVFFLDWLSDYLTINIKFQILCMIWRCSMFYLSIYQIYIFIDFTFIPGIISYGAEEQLAKSI